MVWKFKFKFILLNRVLSQDSCSLSAFIYLCSAVESELAISKHTLSLL